MAGVLHRSTKRYLQSVNTPDYPSADWIIDPDLTAVVGYGSQYWVITGDAVTLMSQAERDVVDAAALSSTRDAVSNQLDAQQDVMVEFFKLVIIELNRKTDKINGILDAAVSATNLGSFKAAMEAISKEPSRTIKQLKTALRSALDN